MLTVREPDACIFRAPEKSHSPTRVANTHNQAELLDLARHASATQIKKLVCAYRRVGRIEERGRSMAQHTSREPTRYCDNEAACPIGILRHLLGIYSCPSSSSTLRATRKHSSACGTPQ